MFINYFRDARRESPINIAIARVVIGGYLIWKVLSYEWQVMTDWPVQLRDLWMFLHPPSVQAFIGFEKLILVGLLLAFVVGYRLWLTTLLSAILVTHLTTLMWAFTASGQTTSLFIAVYFLLFFGLFRDQDELSIDGLRQAGEQSIKSLNARLKATDRPSFRADALKWSLVSVGLIFFGSGIDKVIRTPLTTWMQPENLARILVYRRELYHTSKPVADFLLAHPFLIYLAEASTIILEIGFLVAILTGLSITPFIVMFAGMHTGIALAMGPFFFDLYIFYLLFIPWDRIVNKLTTQTDLDIVYDERCFFCVRSLYPFKIIDANNTITFYSQSDIPEDYMNHPDTDFESEMYVIRDDQMYGGYHAFRELFRHFPGGRWVAWVMGLKGVEHIGTTAYRYVATHRDQHFTCNVNLSNMQEQLEENWETKGD